LEVTGHALDRGCVEEIAVVLPAAEQALGGVAEAQRQIELGAVVADLLGFYRQLR
jgi:hypothetical protein